MANRLGRTALPFVIYGLWSAGWVVYYLISEVSHYEEEDFNIVLVTICMLPWVAHYPIRWLRRYFKYKI